jgi:hypothetical protein
MVFRRNKLPVPGSLIASATRITTSDPVWNAYRLRDQQWQSETWRLYNIIGEFRFAANYVGSACSRVRLFVAEVDELGRVGNEAEDDEVQAVADTLFGGVSAKSEQLRAIGVSLTVAGECFIVGRAASSGVGKRDRWYVIAPSELRRSAGGIQFRFNGEVIKLNPSRDIIIRVWTPHPGSPDLADAPARAALPVLTELEQLNWYIQSQLLSRLALGGILPIPNNIDFPKDDGTPGGTEGLMQALMEAMTTNLQHPGTAASLAPILLQMDKEAIDVMPDKPITFESILSEQHVQLRQEAIRRLATSLDMPPEVLEGAAETNHWGMWYVEENAIKVHIEPLVVRICDALNEAYLAPALRALGREPGRFALWYDTGPLTHRPNRLQDTLNLYERGIVSREEVLRAGDYNPDTAAPDQDEENIRFIKELMLRDPGLFASPPLREAIGIEIETVTPMEVEGTGPPPPPTPERDVTGDTSPTPELPSATRPANTTQDNLIAAADLVPGPTPLLMAADILVTEALRKAGKRLLANRSLRGQFREVPEERIHTKLKVASQDHVERLLEGAWSRVEAYVSSVDVDPAALSESLHDYTGGLLKEAVGHDPTTLRMVLRVRGFPA